MPNLHHTQTKMAAKLGIEILKDGFRHTATGKSVPMGDDPRATFAAFVAEITGKATKPKREKKATKAKVRAKAKARKSDEEEDEEEDESPARSGMIQRDYYEVYQRNGNGCADDLDLALRESFRKYKLGKKGQNLKDYTFDLEGFEKWAKASGCWRDTFRGMNPGQIRMNCSNVARQMIKDGEPIKDFLKHLPK